MSDLSADAFGRTTGKTLTVGEGMAKAAGAVFDLAGRETVETDPSGAARSISYDQAGRPVAVAARRQCLPHLLRRLGRVTDTWVTAKDQPGTKLEHVRTAYDMVTGKPSAVWFADDEAGSKIGYAYFPDGSLREMTYPGGKKQSWTYDNQGRTVTFTDTAGVTTTYTHTDLGQIHTAKSSTGENVTYGYDALGRLNRTTRGNGVITTVEWDDRNQPAVITHTRADGGLVSKNTHEYDVRGNLTKTVTKTPNANGEGARHRGDGLRLRHRRPAHLIHNHKPGRHGHRDRLQAERGLRRHRRDPHHVSRTARRRPPPSRGSMTGTGA